MNIIQRKTGGQLHVDLIEAREIGRTSSILRRERLSADNDFHAGSQADCAGCDIVGAADRAEPRSVERKNLAFLRGGREAIDHRAAVGLYVLYDCGSRSTLILGE